MRHGDLDEHCEPGDTMVIIDGVFYQNASVRHKEILTLIRRQVGVIVAALDRRLSAACVSACHVRLESPQGEIRDRRFTERRQWVAGKLLEEVLSPRLLAAGVARGDHLVVDDACLLWPALRQWCGGMGRAALRLYRNRDWTPRVSIAKAKGIAWTLALPRLGSSPPCPAVPRHSVG